MHWLVYWIIPVALFIFGVFAGMRAARGSTQKVRSDLWNGIRFGSALLAFNLYYCEFTTWHVPLFVRLLFALGSGALTNTGILVVGYIAGLMLDGVLIGYPPRRNVRRNSTYP